MDLCSHKERSLICYAKAKTPILVLPPILIILHAQSVKCPRMELDQYSR